MASFLSMARQELPQAEYDFRKAARQYPFKVHAFVDELYAMDSEFYTPKTKSSRLPHVVLGQGQYE